MDGSDPKEVQMDEALLPFYAEAMDYQDNPGQSHILRVLHGGAV